MKQSSGSGGMDIFGVLLVVFIILKLVGVIDWSWIWVLAPCWGVILVHILIMAVVVATAWIRSR